MRAWLHTFKLPTVHTNCSNNYGPYHFPEKLIPLTILNALEGKPLPVYGRGENVRDWLHVEDHAEALLMVVERGGPARATTSAARAERRNLDVVEAICDLVDDTARRGAGSRRDLIRFVADRPGHDQRYAIDAVQDRARARLAAARRLSRRAARDGALVSRLRAWWRGIRSGAYRGERLGVAV